MSVDFNDANKAWAEKMGITYPLMSDLRRQMSKAYGVLYDDAKMVEDAKTIPLYLRTKRVWIALDKEGTIRYIKVAEAREAQPPTEEILQALGAAK